MGWGWLMLAQIKTINNEAGSEKLKFPVTGLVLVDRHGVS